MVGDPVSGADRTCLTRTCLVALLVGGGFATVLGIACADAEHENSVDRPATYVGGTACATCHQTQADAWAGSHHDLAMQEATEETVLGDFDDASFTHLGVTTTFYRDGDRFIVRTEGPDGQPAEYEVEFTFGVTPLQQYLVPFPGGRHQVLTVAWDTRPASDGGQRWFHLYPDERVSPGDPLHWTRVSQNWNYMCAECHSTGLEKGYDAEARTYQTTWTDLDVSCEACHGPGSRHVELAESRRDGQAESLSGDPDDWLLVGSFNNPGQAWSISPGQTTASRVGPPPSRLEIETCAHCHARRSTLAEGRLPGDALLDFDAVSLLREGLYHPDGQILDEVYVYGSFIQSKMYRAGVTCSNCHDPHTLDVRASGNALCAQCHIPATYDTPDHHFHQEKSAGSQCVECHMPASTFMMVDLRRDHSLRIPRPDLSAAIGTPNACNACHVDQSVDWAVRAFEERYGPSARLGAHYGEAIHAGRSGAPGSAAALAALASDTARPPIARATALSLLVGRVTNATIGALQTGLSNEDPLIRLGALAGAETLPPQALLSFLLPLLADPVKAVRVEAARLLANVPRTALSREQASAIEAGVREYERSLLVNADHPSALANLGNLYRARGQLEASRVAYEAAIATDSTYLPAYLNLAELHRAGGREDLEDQVLNNGMRLFPDAPELLHARGLLLVRRGDQSGAMEWFQRSAESQPENPRFAYVYGVALGWANQTEGAISVFEEALAVHPYDREILTALATYNRDRGDLEAAIAFAERLVEVAPEDPSAQQLLAHLRGSAP